MTTESVVEDAALAWLEGLGTPTSTVPRSRRGNYMPSGRTTDKSFRRIEGGS